MTDSSTARPTVAAINDLRAEVAALRSTAANAEQLARRADANAAKVANLDQTALAQRSANLLYGWLTDGGPLAGLQMTPDETPLVDQIDFLRNEAGRLRAELSDLRARHEMLIETVDAILKAAGVRNG